MSEMHTLEGVINVKRVVGYENGLTVYDVYLDGKHLDPRPSQKLYNHSPDGFSWGYGGSGPAQLALAILMKLMDGNLAMHYHQDFKWWLVSKLPFNEDFDVMFDLDEFLAKVSEKSNG